MHYFAIYINYGFTNQKHKFMQEIIFYDSKSVIKNGLVIIF